MKVALIALSVRGAMGQYLEALVPPLSKVVEVHLFVPFHFMGETGEAIVHRFATGFNQRQALLRFLNPLAAWRVWREVRVVAPGVVHLFNGEGYPWSLIFALGSYRDQIPLLVTVHDPEPHPGNTWEAMNAWLRRAVLPLAAGVHVHSKRFVEVVERLKIERERIHVIPHGSIAERFLKYRQTGIKREPLALFFGRLEAYKGVDLLVDAAIRLNGEIRVIIAGPGKLPTWLEQKIRDNVNIFELHNRYLEDAEVAHLFQQASVCVLPYRQATQSSLPLIAAAFGVPVVATAVGAFVEDVPRVGGILVPPENVEALAQGIFQAMQKKPVYPEEMRFENLAGRFVTVYRSICGR
ncbi:glycosyltransferase family 4 protein [Neomoorella thermoacetica]|uniref:glycosyltransferase family 4 protein n=1 Tax=Neomoorella thermoacetica TaxID=1525 RepID=UPI0008FB1ECD|nr:glycosyltransferase family 4 protein [Moorella thermoacetica]OIQ60437.1 alpha-D-kanosaminyltransferase [Moorella thermoacetica]